MPELKNNAQAHRYEMEENGEIAFADYRIDGGTLVINWVESPPALRGTGAAGRLMTLVAQEAREKGWHIRPVCGYAASWLRASKEHGDLVR
jgi:predicted GNAT family acetyltransferase